MISYTATRACAPKVASASCLLLAFLAAGCDYPGPTGTDLTASVRHIAVTSLLDITDVEQVVSLDVTEDSHLGSVSRVKLDPASNDILVLDRDSTQSIYRFSSRGRFLTRYGPFKHRSRKLTVMDFEPLPNGRVFVATERGIVIGGAGSGGFQSVDETSFLPAFTTAIGDNVCVVAVDRTQRVRDTAIVCYDQRGAEVGNYGEYR